MAKFGNSVHYTIHLDTTGMGKIVVCDSKMMKIGKNRLLVIRQLFQLGEARKS